MSAAKAMRQNSSFMAATSVYPATVGGGIRSPMYPSCLCFAKSTYEAVRLIFDARAGGRLGTLDTSPQLWPGSPADPAWCRGVFVFGMAESIRAISVFSFEGMAMAMKSVPICGACRSRVSN